MNTGARFGDISFVGIHNDWTRENLRVAQCEVLVGELEKREVTVILAGDFNAGRDSESVDLLLGSGFEILVDEKELELCTS